MNSIKYDEKFVIKVNEVFHDIEAELYTERHPEIFIDEKKRWKKLSKTYISNKDNITILDIGSGTGFVPLVISPFLKNNDTIICSDVSSKMIEICKTKIEKKDFECKFQYRKLNGNLNSMKEHSIDIITINSVLHHIPNLDDFYSELNDILSKNGLLIIAHEPNKLFFNNKFLWNNYLMLNKIVSLIPYIKSSEHKSTKSNSIFIKVNNRLISEEVIEKPLAENEIVSIVDIHSPTAGGTLQKERGFDIDYILHNKLTNFDIVHSETYNHCGKATYSNKYTKIYNNILKKIFPNEGAQFQVILVKK